MPYDRCFEGWIADAKVKFLNWNENFVVVKDEHDLSWGISLFAIYGDE